MKILFLCGCVEPGRDGVGDYTRNLAGELLRLGHTVLIIAIRDKFIEKAVIGKQYHNEFAIETSRKPAKNGIIKNLKSSKIEIEGFDPEWISLQFVPYSFNAKGMPILLRYALRSIVRKYNFHIMFHELWVNDTDSIKMKIVGFMQRAIITNLISALKPRLVTTSILLYRERLPDFRIQILPLFGNIPITPLISNGDRKNLQAVHFGTFTSSHNDFENQIYFLNKLSNFYKRDLEFIVFGEGGAFTENALATAKRILGEHRVKSLGRLSSEQISALFQSADIGLSRAGFDMAGKSGSTIAMLEHGLPVLLRGNKVDVNKDKWFNGKFFEQLIFVDSELSNVKKKGLESSLQINTLLFVKMLKNSLDSSIVV